MLANVFWIVDSDGSWDEASNWRDEFGISRVPAPEDDVFLDRPTGNFTINHGVGDFAVNSIHARRNALVVAGGVLTLGAASELGDFSFESLVLNGGLTTSGAVNWSAGTISTPYDENHNTINRPIDAFAFTNTGTLTLVGAGDWRLAGEIINSGIMVQNGGNLFFDATFGFDFINEPVLVNQVSGLYSFQGGASLMLSLSYRGQFENFGRLSASSINSRIVIAFHSFEESRIEVADNSRLHILGPPTNSADNSFKAGTSLTVGQGGVLKCDNMILESGIWKASGKGVVEFGEFGFVGGEGTTFDFPAGMLHISGAMGFTLNVGYIILDGDVVSLGAPENRGTIVQRDSGSLSGFLTNAQGGLYDIQNDGEITGSFVNLGTLRKSAGAGTSTIRGGVNNLGGTLEVQTGILAIEGGGTFTDGVFDVAAGAFLDLDTSKINFSGTFTGIGDGLVRLLNGLSLGPSGATFNFNGQCTTALWQLGSTGLTNRGTLTIVGNGNKRITGVFTNAGTIIHRATGNLEVGYIDGFGNGVSGSFNNTRDGVYDFQADGYFDGFTSTINNDGIIRKSAGAGGGGIGTSAYSTITYTSTGGTFDIRSGTFTVFVGGVYTGGGTFNASAGATLVFLGSYLNPITTMSGAFTGSGAGAVRFSGSFLIVDAGGATFNFTPGLFQWTVITQSSTISGADLTNLGGITLAGVGMAQIVNVFNNAGTISHIGAGNLFLGYGGTLTNQVGALYDFQADQSVEYAGGAFINRGTLRKSGGTGTSTMGTLHNQGGSIEVQSGILALNVFSAATGSATGGTFTVAQDAVLDLSSQGTPTYTGTFTGSGQGIVRLRLVGADFYGFGLNVAGATFNFPPGMFQWLGGTLNGGTAGLNNTGSITLAGTDGKYLWGLLNNVGTIVHAGTGDLTLATANSVLNNLPGSLYDLQGDAKFQGNGGGYSLFDNAGTVRKSAGTGSAGPVGTIDFRNAGGTIDVQSGTFMLNGFTKPALAHTGGTFQVAKDALLVLLDGNRSTFMSVEGNYSGSGEGFVQLAGGNLVVGDRGATFNFPPGMFQWTGGTNSGTIDARKAPLVNRGTITLPEFAVAPIFVGALVNAGTIIQVGEALLSLGDDYGAGMLTNLASGVFEFQGDDGLVMRGARSGFPARFINQGTLRKSSGPGTSIINSDVFDNTGTLSVDSGTVRVESPTVTQVSGATLTAGTWQVSSASSIDLVSAPALTTNSATVILDGPGSSFAKLGTLANNSGSLSLLNDRDFTTAGPLNNSGNLVIAASSTLNVADTFTQTAAGNVAVQLGGEPASGKFGQLVSTGAATLDGTFDVALTGGFGPAAGQSFQVVSFPSHAGSFSAYTGLRFGRFPLFDANLTDTNLVLNALTNTADLAFDSFNPATFPTNAQSGQNVTLTYSVKNLSDLPAVGNWIDSIYLSSDAALDPSDALLARVEHQGGVAEMSSYSETVTAALPPLVADSYRVIVLVDSRGLTSDANRGNNTGVSSQSIAATVPLLALGTPVAGSIAPGQELYYRVLVPPGKDVTVSADFDAMPGAGLSVRYGALPDRTNFDDASPIGSLQPRLLLTNVQGGAYYLHLRGWEDAAGSVAFTLQADASAFEITRVSPLKGSNLGQPAVLDLRGSQFTAQTQVHLRMAGGESRDAQSMLFFNANRIVALVDLADLPTGGYQIVADEPGKTTVAFDTFTVTSNPPGETGAFIWAKTLSANSSAGTVSRILAQQRIAFGEFNTSDSPLPAPLYLIKATNVQPGQEEQGSLGSDTVPPTMLPGNYYNDDVRIIAYKPATGGVGVKNTYELYLIEPTQTSMNWDSQKADLRPSMIPPDAWEAVWANLRPQLGETLADFWRLLTTDSEKLAESGENVAAINRLLSFELQKANNIPAVPLPTTAVDVALPALGLPLVFGRSFGDTISGRYYQGRLGRGWRDNLDISIHDDTATGVVTISSAGPIRLFTRQADGSYQAALGEFGALIRVNGAFQLRETTGEVTAFRTDGLLDFVEDTNGNRITAGYTGIQLTSLTHSSTGALTLAYNAQGGLQQVTDPAGGVTTYEYDPSGEHLVRVTTTAGTTEYGYTADADGGRAHALSSITFLDGSHLFFDYDSQGRLTRRQGDGGVGAFSFAYDVAKFSVADAQNQITTFYYDDSFRIRRVVDPLGRASTIEYDESNRPVIIGTAGGGEGHLGYDVLGNPTSVQNPLGETQAFTYEPNRSRLVNWQDALSHETQFSHDAKGNLLTTTHLDGSTEQYTYDAQGNVLGTVNRLGQNIGFTYNNRGQVIRKNLPDGTQVDYTYTARGNLETVVDASGTTRLEYFDANPDLLTKITYPSGRFLEYTYQNGRRARMVDQSGFAINYEYDAAGRLDVLRDGGTGLIVNYDYDSVGRLVGETHGNGTVTQNTYDSAGQLTKIVNLAPDGAVQSQLVYAYDNLGRRSSVTTGDGVTKYGYDGADRLTEVMLPTGRLITYAYDTAGNRTASSDNGATTNYTVNDLNQYLSFGSTIQTFDAAGNLISSSNAAGSTSYRYDAEGRLVRQITPTGTWSYEYDFLGNRIASTHDGVRTEYLVDPSGLGNVFGEYDGAGNLQAHYVHGLGLTSRVADAGPASYYQFDAIGNTTQLTGSAGVVLNSYSYLPFGETLTASETVANPFEYVGRSGVMQDGSGLDYMRNRWYAPIQGRFTQADPVGLAGGTNFYAYVGNDPVTFVDPSGLNPLLSPLAITLLSPLATTIPGLGLAATVPGSAFAATVPAVNAFAATVPAVDAFGATSLATPAAVVGAAPVLPFAVEVGGAALLGLAGGIALISLFHTGFAAGFAYYGDEIGCLPILPDSWQACNPKLDLLTGKPVQTLTIAQANPSRDPNDIVGPSGFGPEGFVIPQPPLPYTINFQNVPEALGPAAEVVVTQVLDPDLDLDTFQLDEFGFGDITIPVPAGRQFYSTRIDLLSTRGVFVDVTAQLDRATRTVTWTFSAIEPETLDLPSDPFVGFLPPDKVAPEGQGFVSYSARAKTGLPSGARIDAQATIVFDTNEPLDTNVHRNTIDDGPPSSSMNSLPVVVNTATFFVSWSGTDDAAGATGSGIATFDVFVSDNAGPFRLWLDDTTANTAMYSGETDHTYRFYSVATDNVGHVQATSGTAQAQTTVDTTPPVLANMPSDQTIEATMPAGALAMFTLPTASDNLDADPIVSCNRNSGSTFALGTTTVTCTAQDDAGNSSSKSFTVTVQDTTGPTIVNVEFRRQTVRTKQQVSAIWLTASKSLDPSGATNSNNYAVQGLGKTGLPGKTAFIRTVEYDPDTQIVTLVPTKPLKLNVFYQVTVHSAVTDLAGNQLGSTNRLAGTDFVAIMGVGTKLTYIDRDRDTVALTLAGGGVMELTLDHAGKAYTAQALDLLDPVAAQSVLSGQVKQSKSGGDGRARIESISGLAANGVRNQLPASFEIGVISAIVVDSLLAAGDGTSI